jgi:hypothetical protein
MLFKPRIILLLCVVSWLICPRAFAAEGTPGNFKNPAAAKEVLSGKRILLDALGLIEGVGFNLASLSLSIKDRKIIEFF